MEVTEAGEEGELGDDFWGTTDYCGYLRATFDSASGRCAAPRVAASSSFWDSETLGLHTDGKPFHVYERLYKPFVNVNRYT